MKIEMTYKFDMNKYCDETNESFLLRVKDGCNVIYNYTDKLGDKSNIDIFVKMICEDTLLGNDVFNEINEAFDVYAKICFADKEEYNNFILPCWLEKFKYIE